MKAKKVLSLVQAAAMTLSLVACGNSKEEENNTPAPESSAPADNGSEEAKEPAAGEQTLKVAAVETAYGAQMWQDVCAAFEKANPGVKVELTIDKKLEDIITPAMKAGDYPDVDVYKRQLKRNRWIRKAASKAMSTAAGIHPKCMMT